jgi:hypothetical protein
MLIGPLRVARYCAAMRALPHQCRAMVFSVGTPSTWNTARICRWSCRFWPTPGSSWRGSTAAGVQQRPGSDARQLQDLRGADGPGGHHHLASARAPAAARHRPRAAPRRHRRSAPSAEASNNSRDTWAPVHTCRLGRSSAPGAGRPWRRSSARRALVDLEVAHALVVAAVEVVGGRYAGLLPRRRTRRGSPSDSRWRSTRHSPPAPWKASAPRQWSSWARNSSRHCGQRQDHRRKPGPRRRSRAPGRACRSCR